MENSTPDELSKKEETAQNFINEQLNANNDALKGASLSDLANPNSPVYKAPEIPKEEKEIPEKPTIDKDGFPIVQNIRTYHGDVENAVEHDNLTMTKMVMAEQKSRQAPVINPPKKNDSRLHIIIGVISSILFLAGLFAVMFSLVYKTAKESPVAPTKQERDIITSEEKVSLDIGRSSRRQIIDNVAIEVLKTPKDSIIRNIIPVISDENGNINKASVQEFITSLEGRAPNELLRTLYEGYYFGIHFRGQGEPFMIWFTYSYDIASSAMIDWEPYLKDDFAMLFDHEATSTKGFVFRDRVVANQDARSLENSQGKVLFFYSIVNSNTIIFAKTAQTMKEILARLRITILQ